MACRPDILWCADFVKDGRLKEQDISSVVFASKPASGGAILKLNL